MLTEILAVGITNAVHLLLFGQSFQQSLFRWYDFWLNWCRYCNQCCCTLTDHIDRISHHSFSHSLECKIHSSFLAPACRTHYRDSFSSAKSKTHTHVWIQLATWTSSSDCMYSWCTLPTLHAWPHGLALNLVQGHAQVLQITSWCGEVCHTPGSTQSGSNPWGTTNLLWNNRGSYVNSWIKGCCIPKFQTDKCQCMEFENWALWKSWNWHDFLD